ncbi:MAG: hypothetical protein AB7D43_12740 [Sulfurimonadaceae bacterium]
MEKLHIAMIVCGFVLGWVANEAWAFYKESRANRKRWREKW